MELPELQQGESLRFSARNSDSHIGYPAASAMMLPYSLDGIHISSTHLPPRRAQVM